MSLTLPRWNIDQINIVLMLLSCAVAFAIPFELVLISYAFLGPAHYLTEISWLHDRNYFTDTRLIWVPLVLLAGLALVLSGGTLNTLSGAYYLFSAALSCSLAVVLLKGLIPRIAGTVGFMALFIVLGHLHPPFVLGLAFLLPTIIHIYVFTGMFILTGAFKSRSVWGYASLGVYIACGLSFWFITPSTVMLFENFVAENLSFFDPLVDYVTTLVSFDGRVNSHSVTAFLSFAYTYHYLNWFSKTEVIKWHLIPRRRLWLIVALYGASVALYLVDYRVGFIALTFLRLAHVLLELPLNVLSFKMVGQYVFLKRA